MEESDIVRAEERIQKSVDAALAGISRSLKPGEQMQKDCVDCGTEIPEKRLRAAPWTKRCISCQEGFER